MKLSEYLKENEREEQTRWDKAYTDVNKDLDPPSKKQYVLKEDDKSLVSDVLDQLLRFLKTEMVTKHNNDDTISIKDFEKFLSKYKSDLKTNGVI